ncbi:MAG TPA: hypothetical protein VIM65_14895 [Cyclobacteriaceae bacterium]
MKNSLVLIILLIAGMCALQNCNNHDIAPSEALNGVVFMFRLPNDSTGNSLKDSVKNISNLNAFVSLNTSTGEEVFSRKKVSLEITDDGLVSVKIALPFKRYVITDLFLTQDSSTVLFATPHRGSLLSKTVKYPLDYSFSVVNYKYTYLPMEVVQVGTHSPEDFGYRSFSLEALKFFSMGVHTIVNGKSSYASSQACVLRGTDTLASYSFGPSVNVLKFNCENTDELTLVVIKDGFARYTKSFTFPDLLIELNKKPLTVNLTAALTLRLQSQDANADESNVQFDLDIDGAISLMVDWGDGVQQEITAAPYQDGTTLANAYFDHTYPKGSVNYFISITGSLDKILGYAGDHNEFLLDPVTVSALTSLKNVDLSVSGTPELIDLRQNIKLEKISLGADSVLLPKKNALSNVRLFSEMASSLDYVISNVYSNATASNTNNGKFNFSAGVADNDSNEMIAMPSESSLSKLIKLRDVYHWTIYPNP